MTGVSVTGGSVTGGSVTGGTVTGGGVLGGGGAVDGRGVGFLLGDGDGDGEGEGEGDGEGPSVITGMGVGVASTPRLGSMIGPNVTPGGRLTGGGSVPIETPLGIGVSEPVGVPAPPGTKAW